MAAAILENFNLFMLLAKIIHDHNFLVVGSLLALLLRHLLLMQFGLIDLIPLPPRNTVPGINPPLSSIKRNFHPFIGRVSGQRIGYLYIVRVLYLNRHFIININLMPPETIIADISIVFLIRYI